MVENWFKNNTKLYNFIFPFWLMLALPPVCIFALVGNFIIDSIVLLVCMKVFQINNKKQFYRKKIMNVFGVGWISDIIGVVFMLFMIFLRISNSGEELYVTIPAVAISALAIFLLNYFKTFKDSKRNFKLDDASGAEKTTPKQRFWFSVVFSVITAPYTFLIPLEWVLDLIQK